ncbi:2,3-diaminopropionate biosynthesis protein SbnB [Micromonospora sp. WMMD734]|uniref:2,3-diaminopropionate biosynthesis protein SbnB n=1 Tax=unclassified Micromonospora TaxID=2617518 RepID=UPI00249B863E|nr:2,3-diaminopropionate biosynthesis protein SbnB [Micromonospora sp. WMMD712]WFE59498.1 2,3-diaminopropionate biosynthesis protein SbnB [Micromonospora sp. WMMD712]
MGPGSAVADRPAPPAFSVVTGAQVQQVLRGRERQIVDLVGKVYALHGRGDTVNPPSYFLRFPDRPSARIIALPASVGGEVRTDGIKWISSVPANIEHGIPRASAVLVLNDPRTGFPYACLEGSVISAVRTAASAALALDRLTRDRERPRRIGFVGGGLIARYVHSYLAGTGWDWDAVGVYDLSPEYAGRFRDSIRGWVPDQEVRVHDDLRSLVRDSDVVVFATVAAEPHVTDPAWFSHRPVVLHLSLRDLSPEVVLSAVNVVDDVEHCLKASTSVHLTEQRIGNREFLAGTLAEVMAGDVVLPRDRPVVFSPFGLGVLDIAVGRWVYDRLAATDGLGTVDGFFSELSRYA